MALDHEIKRVCDQYYNHVTPIAEATIQTINDTLADIYIEKLEINLENVPILTPCYIEEGEQTLGIEAGDKVIVAFLNGHCGNPIIIGGI